MRDRVDAEGEVLISGANQIWINPNIMVTYHFQFDAFKNGLENGN